MEAAQIPKGQFMEGSVSSMSKLLPICQCVIYQKCVTQKGGFEFRLNYCINMERAGGDVDFSGKSK